MLRKKTDIVMLSNCDWDSFWFQKQEFAKRYCEAGYRVVFVNRSPQRWPKLFHILRRLKPSKKGGHLKNPRPQNLEVITPLWLPPASLLRWVSRYFVQRTVKRTNLAPGYLLITFLPTYNALDFIRYSQPGRVAYVNVHNYDADERTMPDLLRAEVELAKRADFIFGDSVFNQQRVNRISGRSDAMLSPPGVATEAFASAWRGDEAERRKSIGYFGGVGSHMDIELYNQLAEQYRVVFVGVVSPELSGELSEKIELRDPVEPSRLPNVLREFDMLAIFYTETAYIDGVIPAKFFECLATRKPLLVSGLKEARQFGEVVYDISGSADRAFEVIVQLGRSESVDRISIRFEVAREADWTKRFGVFCRNIQFGDEPDAP